jgi:glucosamine-phosphate N-acetyltransferase
MFLVREITNGDFFRGYLELLEQLTVVEKDKIDQEKFSHFVNMLNSNHKIYVIEDIVVSAIIGTGTILIENKIIHGISKVGHIEDIVIRDNYRNKGLGKLIIDRLVKEGKEQGCYKIILNCSEANTKFYEKCEFVKKEVEMVKYL